MIVSHVVSFNLSFLIPVVRTPANTQHCPYLTGRVPPLFMYSSSIATLPVHADGFVPPL